MALSNNDRRILEEIVALCGDCLDGRPRCENCPFRAECLPEFINVQPPSKHKRLEMAKRVLFHNLIFEDDDEGECSED